MGYIYKIINIISKKIYIGQTIQNDINTRWNQHKRNIHTTKSCLYSAFRKYGLHNFSFQIICICFDEACDELERFYISKYNTLSPNGYNLDLGGNKNKIIHKETKEKIRKSHLGKKHSESRKQKNRDSHIGYKHTQISKDKMSVKRKGKELSEEIRKRMSDAQKGHSVSEKTRQNVAEANKRRIWTNEMKGKVSLTLQQDKSRNKPVEQYSKNCEFIKLYGSIKEASEQTSVNRNSIAKVCYGQRKTGGGFIWKFIDI
jgi:group I intron endonuclease